MGPCIAHMIASFKKGHTLVETLDFLGWRLLIERNGGFWFQKQLQSFLDHFCIHLCSPLCWSLGQQEKGNTSVCRKDVHTLFLFDSYTTRVWFFYYRYLFLISSNLWVWVF